MLRPGAERIAALGGLQRFTGWNGPMLTDSGGFQVMSLADLRKVSEHAVTFRSHIDGAKVELSPERSIEVQRFQDAATRRIPFQKKIGVGLFGGEGFIMQKLEGDGLCFANAGGMVHALDLGPGQTLRVDTGCLVALQPSVNYDIQFVGGVKTAFFGGEGLFFATLRGPGKVWLQSLPLSRLADRLYKAAPQTGRRKEEGSVLGGIGNLLDGDG
jgi:hypothetical protein